MSIIPFLTSSDEALEAVYRSAKNAGASYVLAGGLNLKGRTRQGFFDSVRAGFPSEYGKVFGIYKDKLEYKKYKLHVQSILETLRKEYGLQSYGKLQTIEEAQQLSFL